MSRPLTWKRLLVAPAVLSLTLGGVLLTAGPAAAVPGDAVAISSPTDGSIASTRTVVVSGVGSDGDEVVVTVDSGDVPDQTVAVELGGGWTAELEFGDDADVAQTITALQTESVEGTVTTDSVTIQLPVIVAPVPFAVTTPTDGAAIDSRFVDFSGTAPAGSTVTATVNGVEGYGSIDAADDGTFAFQGAFPFDVGTQVAVVITATDENGVEIGSQTVNLTLRAPLPAPVITSPATGSSITGGTVTFTGTGTAGTTAFFGVFPSDEATAAKLEGIDPAPLLPTSVVAADGTFRVTTTLPLGNYTAFAILTDTPPTDPDAEVRSLESNEIEFSLVAAAAPASSGAVLADTGAASTGFVAPAAALLLAGIVMAAAGRRRGALV